MLPSSVTWLGDCSLLSTQLDALLGFFQLLLPALWVSALVWLRRYDIRLSSGTLGVLVSTQRTEEEGNEPSPPPLPGDGGSLEAHLRCPAKRNEGC